VQEFLALEKTLIDGSDEEFRFHSGVVRE
jgi:tRNA-(ms[2]io[6]A)-hydroxylase